VSYLNLGLVHSNLGRGPEAETELKKALEIFEGTLGADHLGAAAAHNGLGGLYYDQNRYPMQSGTGIGLSQFGRQPLGRTAWKPPMR
jgi:hypothetical protein